MKKDYLKRFLKETPENQVLAISSNLRRLSNWAYEEPSKGRLENINTFLKQTLEFSKNLEIKGLSPTLQKKIKKFRKEFPKLAKRWPVASDNRFRRLLFAEEMLTWSCLLG